MLSLVAVGVSVLASCTEPVAPTTAPVPPVAFPTVAPAAPKAVVPKSKAEPKKSTRPVTPVQQQIRKTEQVLSTETIIS